jgi:hypothetical protein
MAGPKEIPSQRFDVACPYFMPIARLENGSWPHPSRLPLGAGWSGHCTAPGHEQSVPSDAVLESFCNLGYATNCSWAPQQRSCDSVRFAIAAPEKKLDHNSEPARILRVTYVCERDHRPAGHGELEFDLLTSTWLLRHQDVRIQKMAECFLETYLSKRS